MYRWLLLCVVAQAAAAAAAAAAAVDHTQCVSVSVGGHDNVSRGVLEG